ncbi:hypothetical protein K439DRAFT_1310923, partial [Ramaria rubella]
MYPPPKFPFEAVTETQIHSAIRKLKPYKAAGPSGISNAILIHCAQDLVPHLIHIYRATFHLRYYPPSWRISTSLALRKVGKTDYTIAKSYRPIALLENLAKLLSACVAENIMYHTLRLKLLPNTHFRG